MQIQVKEGLWHAQAIAETNQCKRSKHILLRHEESNCLPSMEIGTLSIDGGALYVRACGKDDISENKLKAKLMEMGQASILESIRNMAVSTRKSIGAVFFPVEMGDGEYKVYVDDALKYTSPKITQKTKKFNTGNIDLTGANYVKIVVEKGEYGCTIISDLLLKNK